MNMIEPLSQPAAPSDVEQILTRYRLQLPDQELLGTIVIREGRVADIQPGISSIGQDGGGQLLLPGLIELHTDHLETCVSPRPGVRWPMASAVVSHDRQLIHSGITTVYDALSMGDIQGGSLRLSHSQSMIDGITAAQAAGRLLADHRLHLRCELSYGQVVPIVETYIDHPLLSLISLMDHTPGYRQFVNLDKFKEYYMGKHGLTIQQVEQFILDRTVEQHRYAIPNRDRLVQLAQERGLPIASHDDATPAHVEEAIQNGALIAEFPTTLEAAQTAHEQDLKVLMGAPNVVLGGSHSGNIAALDLMERGYLDILSSDYAPQSLLQAIFLIAQTLDRPLYQTQKLVTQHPAEAIGLSVDRGSLEVGKRADLITVYDDGVVPQLTSVICRGRRVA